MGSYSNKDNDDESEREYFLRRVAEELRNEGEDLRTIWQKTEDALKRLIESLAKRLRTTVANIWRALEELGNRL